jgi:hypothetical protein
MIERERERERERARERGVPARNRYELGKACCCAFVFPNEKAV